MVRKNLKVAREELEAISEIIERMEEAIQVIGTCITNLNDCKERALADLGRISDACTHGIDLLDRILTVIDKYERVAFERPDSVQGNGVSNISTSSQKEYTMISRKATSKKDSDKDDSMGDESTGAVPTNIDSHAHRRLKTRYRRGERMFIHDTVNNIIGRIDEDGFIHDTVNNIIGRIGL